MASLTPQQFAEQFGMVPGSAAPPANPPSQFIAHRTIAGERWDSIAWKYYGDATLISALIMANPAVPIEAVFEAGISIEVPILQQSVNVEADLPPWETL
jgi:phage tail protein X